MILLAGVLKRSDLERLAYLKAIDNRSDLELFPNNPAFLGPHKDLGAWILRIFASLLETSGRGEVSISTSSDYVVFF